MFPDEQQIKNVDTQNFNGVTPNYYDDDYERDDYYDSVTSAASTSYLIGNRNNIKYNNKSNTRNNNYGNNKTNKSNDGIETIQANFFLPSSPPLSSSASSTVIFSKNENCKNSEYDDFLIHHYYQNYDHHLQEYDEDDENVLNRENSSSSTIIPGKEKSNHHPSTTLNFLSELIGNPDRLDGRKYHRNDYESLDGFNILPSVNETTLLKRQYRNYQLEENDNSLGSTSGSGIFNTKLINSNFDQSNEKHFLLRLLNREGIYFVGYLILYSVFLMVGSLCFQAIEGPMEQFARETFRNSRKSFLQKYPQIEEDDLETLLAEVVKAKDRGLIPLQNATPEHNWGFGQALFFSSTVVTTIGYGHVTPLSQTGKIFCMIYATIGIPLTLVLISAVVERLLLPANWLLGTLNAKLGHLYQPFNIRLLHLFIIIFIVGVLFFATPTIIFSYLEPSWNLFDAFYYCFISLSTIGLGDYIPGEGISAENQSLYKICITFYLFTGLIAIMLALTVFYDIPQLNLGQLFTENASGETEKLRLSGSSAPCYSGPSGLYIPQRDEDVRRAVVRIRPHGDESPSPDEHPNSMNRDLRVP